CLWFFFSSRRRHTRFSRDWSSDVCSSDLEDQRRKLASGALVIVDAGEGFELLPRAAADQVRERDESMIVVDHGQAAPEAVDPDDEDAAYYAQFKVPDDLMW